MNHPGPAASRTCEHPHAGLSPRHEQLQHAIEHAAHFLPSQAPISVFVHHNTLHTFEARPFHEAVQMGARFYRCQAYLSKQRYRQELARGRILATDISAVLLEDLDDEADRLIGCLATRYQLRLAMLKHPVQLGSDEELQWLLAESDVLDKFCPETPPGIREQMIERTRRWVLRDLNNGHDAAPQVRQAVTSLFSRFDHCDIESWSDATWESFTLRLLWQAALDGVTAHYTSTFEPGQPAAGWSSSAVVASRLFNEELIRYSAAFLDQGLARWRLPHREAGYFRAWCELNRARRPFEPWLAGLPAEIARIDRQSLSPLELIDESLEALAVPEGHREEFITRSLLDLKGWAGMLWQMETNAEWTIEPAPRGTLVEYLAVRLLLERLARVRRTQDRTALVEAGELMYASHWSYGQRCGMGSIETDVLVNLIREAGPDQGLFGAKVTAGGCGGALAVLMADSPVAQQALEAACAGYVGKTGRTATVLRGSSPGAAAFGARFLNQSESP